MAKRLDDLMVNGLKVYQETDYFCFGKDSVLLANFVTSNRSDTIILDLCSGSGVISFLISAKKKYQKIIALELQQEMFTLLEENIKLNRLEKNIFPIQEDVKCYEKIKQRVKEITKQEKIDIIVCNPPYKKQGTGCKNGNLVKDIARHEIKCQLEDIFVTASKLLQSKGKLYLVHKPDRLVDLIALARTYHLEAKKIQFVYPTVNKNSSIVLIEYSKDGGMELEVLPPLVE